MGSTVETFPTRLGSFSAVWNDGKLRSLALEPSSASASMKPETSSGSMKPSSSSPSSLGQRVALHLAGQPQDFRDVPLDLDGIGPFAQKVYQAAQAVPSGRVTTYGQMAQSLGSPGASRAVGTALGKNPFLLIVPCHRVVGSDRALRGFSAPGGLATKAKILAAEGYGTESLWDPAIMAEGSELLSQDPRLGPVVVQAGPCTLEPLHPEHPFAALVHAVLHQHIAGSAARAIEQRVQALGSAPLPTAEELLALDEETLRAAGLSTAKTKALWALSKAALEGSLRVEELRLLPDDQVVAEVSKIKGFGSWTAEMFLLFHLGRRDLMPVKDLGIRKGFARLWSTPELPNEAMMLRWSKPWRPYRSLATLYLWRSLEL